MTQEARTLANNILKIAKDFLGDTQQPIPQDKEDGEDELWEELGRILYGGVSFQWAPKKLEYIKSKFHITRKTPNQ